MNRKVLFYLAQVVFVITVFAIIVVQRREINELNGFPGAPAAGSHAGAAHAGIPAKSLALDNLQLEKILAIPDHLERLRALLDFTQGLNAAGLCTVLQKMAGDEARLRGDNNLAMTILVARLAQLDPQAALDWANTQLTGPAQREILAALFDAWSSTDPKAAFASMNSIQNVSERAQFESAAFKNMANRDPQAALKILQSLPLSEQTHDNFERLFTTWASNDPKTAAAAVLGLPLSRNRDFAIENVLQGWGEVDPRSALAWAAQLPGGVRADALSTAVGMLALQDPKAAIDYLNTVSNPNDRNNLMGVIASNWGKVNPTEALAWVDDNVTGQAHDKTVLSLLNQLSQTDPAQAATLLDHLPAGMQDQGIAQIANNWAMQDLKGAMGWVQGLPEGANPNAAIKQLEVSLINTLTNADPAQAAAYVQTIQGNPLYGRLVEQVAANWVGSDPQAAMTWAQSLPMDQGGYNAVLQVITQYTNKDPQAAWNLATGLPEGQLRDQTMNNVFGKWVARDPAQAANLLPNLPDALQTAATAQLTQTWLRQNPQAAEQWVNTLPAGVSRDQAVAQIISIEGANDLPTAYTWAATIGNDNTRFSQIRQVMQQWAQKDPNAAAAAAQNANVSDQQRATLLNMVQRYLPAN